MAINKFDIGKSEDEFDIETRIVNAGYADEDGDIEIGLRPKVFDDYVGQERAKEKTECMNSVTQMPIKSVVPSMTWT